MDKPLYNSVIHMLAPWASAATLQSAVLGGCKDIVIHSGDVVKSSEFFFPPPPFCKAQFVHLGACVCWRGQFIFVFSASKSLCAKKRPMCSSPSAICRRERAAQGAPCVNFLCRNVSSSESWGARASGGTTKALAPCF